MLLRRGVKFTPKSKEDFVKSSIDTTKLPMGGGAAAVLSGKLGRIPAAILGAGLGAAGGMLLGGGGTQEQSQKLSGKTSTDTTQSGSKISPNLRAILDLRNKIATRTQTDTSSDVTDSNIIDSTVGSSITRTSTKNITKNLTTQDTYTYAPQTSISKTTSTQTGAPQSAEQTSDMSGLLLIGALAVGGYMLLKGRR